MHKVLSILATTNNYGNTAVDFDITATVFKANPSDVKCGTQVDL